MVQFAIFFFFFFFFVVVSLLTVHYVIEQLENLKSIATEKRLPLGTKNPENHENWKLGLIESLHM